ncbi:GFA family protein [Elongatibacter sediminis]|uniref:GFA family protein n=1 Tax=Elongatibacter sediminis TaxID=3119006 RepID=A0AAW9RM65_9GAMM
MSQLTGGCFCGVVRYTIDGPLVRARSCHCSRCRKVFSGAGSAFAELRKPADFRWVSGTEHLNRYATDGEFGLAFCATYGSTLCGLYRGEVMGITLGSVDGDPGVQIEAHIFVDSKAPWDHIGGTAPQYPEGME